MECKICFESLEGNQSWVCPECKFQFCLSCLRSAIDISSFAKPFCPNPDCNRQFSNSDMLHILPTKTSLKTWMRLKIERFNEAFDLDLFRCSEDVLQLYRELDEVANYINTNFRKFIVRNMIKMDTSNLWDFINTYLSCRFKFKNLGPIDLKFFKTPIIGYNFRRFAEDEPAINSIIYLINNCYLTVKSFEDIHTFCKVVGLESNYLDAFIFERIFSNIDFFKPFNNRPISFSSIFIDSAHIDKNFNISINPKLAYSSYIRESTHESPLEKQKIKIFYPCTCGGKFIKLKDRCSAICTLCEKCICTKCGTQKTLNSPHSCNEEEKLNFETIKRNSKACPNCGVRIQRSEGCSQMFCIICHIGFDYNTGEIIKSNFHNPHRAEWLAQIDGGISLNNEACQDFPLYIFRDYRFKDFMAGHRGIIINLAMFVNCFNTTNKDEEYKVRFIKKRLKREEISRHLDVEKPELENHKFHEYIARSLKLYKASRIAFIEMRDFITSFADIAKSICISILSYSNPQVVENSILAFKLLVTFFEKIELEFIPFFTYKSIYLDILQIHISYQYIKRMVNCFSLVILDSYLGLSTTEKSNLIEEIPPLVKKLDSVLRSSAKTFSSFYSEISQN